MSGAGMAEESTLEDSFLEDSLTLDTLVITASGYEQEETDAPASISVISSEDLENHSYTDLTDALRDVPGLVVTGGGGGDNGVDISLRGMSSSYTLLLVDGKRVASRETRPNGSAGFETDWLPPLDAIERIEVVRGPMSTLYGSDAMGGVINVITKKVQNEWHGNIQQEITLQQHSRFGNERQTSFNLSGPIIEDKLGLQLYGRYFNRSEDNVLNGQEDKALQNINGKLSFTPNENNDFVFEAGATSQEREGNMGKSLAETGCRGGCTDSDDKHYERHFAVSHTGRWDIGTTDTHLQREIAKNKTRQIEITNTTGKSTLAMPLGDHMLNLGASFEKEELEDSTTNTLSDRTQVDNTSWALFAEDEWWLRENFSLTGGARLDKDENYGNHVSPRLYGVWHMTDRWTLKGGAAVGFRSPSLREVTSDWGQTSRGGDIYGNPDLKPETSLSKEISLHYNGDNGWAGSLTLFHNDFEDKITRVECPASICTGGANSYGSNPTYRVNVDEAITRGVEASLEGELTPTLDFTASYTFTDSEQLSGEYKGQPLTQLPRHLLSVGLDWQATDDLKPWLRVTYRGKESEPTTTPSSSTLVAPSSTLVDAGLGYQLTDSTTLKAGIYNLLDEDINYDEYGYVADGRRLWLGLNWSF
ncbi:ligand-gated channel protein [Pokkaliibacter sp. CJK22405]|uniref:ligand-gated channel protein n=1 Tax=Pokkaliibacter sp. CJK22405 TaxID=3384615 RepID=UPI0039847B85